MTEPHTLTDTEVCENASSGEWYADDGWSGAWGVFARNDDKAIGYCWEPHDAGSRLPNDKANAAFISRFNPHYVKQMLEENARLREALEPFVCNCSGRCDQSPFETWPAGDPRCPHVIARAALSTEKPS